MRRRLEQLGLVAAMWIGAIVMWTAVPAAWVWLAGRYARVSQGDMASFVLLFTGMPMTMFALGLGLGRLDRRYASQFNPTAGPSIAGARWLHSLRGGSETEPATLLDKILIVNIGVAILADVIWFAFFAHGSQAPR